ncbi:MAG TPA: glycoside hydrolase family 3 N-terminal domain-containing protein [Ktedonobacteraceae bacterium]|nr:glycoside hydrolase family 3 N-terminal domain-containing protein [Ktedonobacteraceae bacterium]
MSMIQANSANQAEEALSPDPKKQSERKPRRRRIILLLLLLFLVMLVVLGGVARYTLFAPKPVVATVTWPSGKGAFALEPLSAAQIDALQHLPENLQYKKLAQIYVSHMTLDEKLGQLIMAQALTGYDTANTADTMYMLNQLHANGIIMYAIQMNSFKQTKADIQNMQLHASTPLFVSADEEGGFVERIENIFGHRPGALETYQTGKVSNATKLGQSITNDLRSLGINTDLAPDIDVLQASSPSLYTRTWGYTPQSVIQYGGAYLRAVQGAGEVAALKHFPGLGAAKTDPHSSLPVIKSTKDQIYSVDLAPYKYFLSSSDPLNNPGMIMSTDLMMPALDPTLPAELSPTIINGVLRHDLHYDGVVITDALYMDGIAKKWNLVTASIMALNAGCDILLGARGSYEVQMVINGLKQALNNGTVSMSRVNEAVTRIIALKYRFHILQIPY